MSRFEKLLKRFLSKPTDFTYDELTRLLSGLGYEKVSTGKTAGSRVAFINPETRHIIKLHRPHPRPELKRYQLVTFEGCSVDELIKAFHEEVDDYTKLCKEMGKEPTRSYKGSFNVRIPPEMHRRVVETAIKKGLSLNQLIQKAIEKELVHKD